MRAEIEDRASPRGDSQPSPELLARIRLLEDKPEWALRALGGPVRARRAGRSSASRWAWSTSTPIGWRRPASATRWPRRPAARRAPRRSRGGEPRRAAARRGAAQGGSPHAGRGGGRAHRRRRVGAGPARGGRGRSDHRARRAPSARWRSPSATRPTAISGSRRRAPPTGVSPTALRADEDARRDRRHLSGLALVGAVCRRGRPASRAGAGAAARSRARFAAAPRCSRTSRAPSNELRHDVLKHRASVLGLLADAERPARRDHPRRMTEPRPTSVMVATIYDRLDAGGARPRRHAARPGARAGVRRAARAISRRAETPARRVRAATRELAAIDERLRGPHADALADLLQLGPRTRLDAATLSAWIASVEASARQAGGGLDGARARRSPIWPSNSRSSTTRWPRSS